MKSLFKEDRIEEAMDLLSEDQSLLYKSYEWDNKKYNKFEILDVLRNLSKITKYNLGKHVHTEMYIQYQIICVTVYINFLFFKFYLSDEYRFCVPFFLKGAFAKLVTDSSDFADMIDEVAKKNFKKSI